MSFDPHDFRGFVSHVLRESVLHSPAAVELLLGTCAVESNFGQHRQQIRGPALGVMQIEPATFHWLRQRFGRRYGFEERIFLELRRDDRLSVLVARLRYIVDPETLPPAEDIEGLGRVWKRVYNTAAGRGRVEDFVRKYQQFVLGVVA